MTMMTVLLVDGFAVCRLLRDGVAAIVGPTVAATSRHVQSVCEAVEVPHFRAHWDLDVDVQDRRLDGVADSEDSGGEAGGGGVGGGGERGLYSVSVHPPYAAVSRAFIDFVRAHNWNSFAVLYDSDDGIHSHI